MHLVTCACDLYIICTSSARYCAIWALVFLASPMSKACIPEPNGQVTPMVLSILPAKVTSLLELGNIAFSQVLGPKTSNNTKQHHNLQLHLSNTADVKHFQAMSTLAQRSTATSLCWPVYCRYYCQSSCALTGTLHVQHTARSPVVSKTIISTKR